MSSANTPKRCADMGSIKSCRTTSAPACVPTNGLGTASATKSVSNNTAENFLYALPLLTSKRGHLPDDATLRKQLSGLQRRVVGGHETVGHAQVASAHDDLAAAVCGCLVEAASRPPPMVITPAMIGEIAAAGRYGRAGPSAFAIGERQQAQLAALRRRPW